MTPAEVGDVFQVNPRTVWRWEGAGELDSVRLPSGVRRYFHAQVQALLRGEKLTPEQVRALRERIGGLKIRPPGVHIRALPGRRPPPRAGPHVAAAFGPSRSRL